MIKQKIQAFKQLWDEKALWISEQPLKKRATVLLMAYLLVYGVWMLVFQMMIDIESNRLSTEIKEQNKKIKVISKRVDKISEQVADNRKSDLTEEHAELQKKIQQGNEGLDHRAVKLVSPQKMIAIVRQVLKDTRGVKLLQFRILPAENLLETANTQTVQADASLNKEALEITLEGQYFQILDYLERLESAPARFFWDSLSYEVTEYPKAKIVLRLSFVSKLGAKR